jgi:uncharacterized Rmd1/YagE family protein
MQQQQQQPSRSKPPTRLGPTRKPSFSLPRSTSITTPLVASQAGSTKPPAAQRTSKTHQRLVELPSDPQTRPLPTEGGDDDAIHGYETDAGVRVRENKSAAERMTKAERRRAGCRRITAYWLADSFRMKLLANFLKREHNVVPRSFDEALYVVSPSHPLPRSAARTCRPTQMYHLPLLPGYGPAAKVRSSVPAPSHTRRLTRMSQAEEDGYTGSYFIPGRSPENGFWRDDGYIASHSPPTVRREREPEESELDGESRDRGMSVEPTETPALVAQEPAFTHVAPAAPPEGEERTPVLAPGDDAAEIVFFTYGVAVFFGFDEIDERYILEDVHGAGAVKGARQEGEWEVEECHFAVSSLHPRASRIGRPCLLQFDPTITYPRIYNDFFSECDFILNGPPWAFTRH